MWSVITNLLINWFPMLLIVALWIFFIFRMRKGPYSKYQMDCMELTRRQVEALERMVTLLEKKDAP